MDIREISLVEDGTLAHALEKLDKSGLGMLFITSATNQLTGIITDGDVRRALLRNHTLDSKVSTIMNRSFVSLPVDAENTVILSKLDQKIKIIPLVDRENHLIDYASLSKIRTIPIAAPSLNGNELAYVTECIKTSWISSQGKFVRKFEDQFSRYHEGRRSLAVSNGTVALHLALVALGIGEGDEVIVPDLTFAASINSVLHAGAIPILADVDPVTWNIDTRKLVNLISPKTRAIMPVHLFGNPCNMDDIMSIAEKFDLLVIEDCAEALGSYHHRRPVGVFGHASTFSFYGNKILTTGEGGMILFKDEKVADRAEMLRDHGMLKSKRYWHTEVGFNYRLTNIQAAIGVAQFERLDEFVAAKRRIAASYNEVLKGSSHIQTPVEHEGMVNSYWLYTILVKEGAPFASEDLIAHLNQNAVETRPVFFPLHLMPPYKSFGSSEALQFSAYISKNGVSLPSFVGLTGLQLAHVVETLRAFLKKYSDA